MKNNKGFTLTEILLAAMIVGVIGIALAGLTTAAVRESGIARTRTMLRQQLSTAMRQLRQDVQQATSAQIEDSGKKLVLTYDSAHSAGPKSVGTQPTKVEYKFEQGTVDGAGGGTTGGVYHRKACPTDNDDECSEEVWLTNVKSFFKDGVPFASPRFLNVFTNHKYYIQVRIILEVPTSPVVNETVQETFVLPSGVIL